MPLTSTESRAVEDCLRELLRAHIAMPFGILRERGVVSELRNLLLEGPFQDSVRPQEIVQYPGRQGRQPTPCAYVRDGVDTRVHRVQQEIETALEGRVRSGSVKQLDIAVLRQAPTLHCATNGAGDVVQWVQPTSVDAAIEVKASPSTLNAQRGEYVKDIRALLQLAARHQITGYFLLLDKSLALYGRESLPPNVIAWETSKAQSIKIRGPKKPDENVNSLSEAGISISHECPARPHIQVWTVGLRNCRWEPVRLYAHASLAA